MTDLPGPTFDSNANCCLSKNTEVVLRIKAVYTVEAQSPEMLFAKNSSKQPCYNDSGAFSLIRKNRVTDTEHPLLINYCAKHKTIFSHLTLNSDVYESRELSVANITW